MSATIQLVSKVQKHPNADTLDIISVLGWQCVAKLGEFKEGDKCVYIEIDSIITGEPTWAEFLKNKGYRVKTIKLRGELSQGLALPLSTFNIDGDIGVNLSEKLGVEHYEKPEPHQQGAIFGLAGGKFPPFIKKTDEIRVQNKPRLLQEIVGKEVYVTTKIDGSSATYAKKNGEFLVCSRNVEKQKEDTNIYSRMALKYDLESKLPEGFVVQGEIAGPGVQKNRPELPENDLLIFNVIENGRYLNYWEMVGFCETLGLKMVPLDSIFTVLPEYDMNWWLEKAKGKYENSNNFREGIVVRCVEETWSSVLRDRLSFKVVNNDYLLKYGE